MKRYKVAIVSDTFLPQVGGLEVHMHDLAEELTRQGHEAHVICATPDGLTDSNPSAYPVHRINVPLFARIQRVRSTKFYQPLARLLSDGDFDLVHAHCVYSPLGQSACYIAKQLGIPSVLTLHSVIEGSSRVALRSFNWLARWGNWPTVLTAVSQYVSEELKRVSGRDDVVVLPNAVRLQDWTVERAETQRVISVTRLASRKRPLDLIRMIPAVLDSLPRHLWPVFTIVGDGPERPKVESAIKRLGIAEHVELTGVVSRSAVRDMLSRSSIFALPSYHEAYPIAVIEARSAGLPVVARTPNGVAEIIEHGKQGLLAASSEEFVRYLVTLIRDPALRAQMSFEALQGIEKFGWEYGLQRHLDLYRYATERFDRHRPAKHADRPRLGEPLVDVPPRPTPQSESTGARTSSG